MKILLLLFLFVIKNFGKQIKQFRSTSQAPTHHCIDGVVDNKVTSELFRDKLSVTLNKHAHHSFNSNSLEQSLDTPIYPTFSFETVFEAIQHLKRDKRDDSDLISNHYCCPRNQVRIISLISF